MPKSVYLAGPEVFLPNAREILDLKAALTRAAGLIPVSPGDLEFPPTSSKWELGLAISAIDEKLMHGAHAIIANLTPFRGLAADTGTCFELGFMCALGKPAFAYTNVKADQGTRTRAHFKGEWYADAEGCPRGPDHMLIEDLGFIDNLMLHGAHAIIANLTPFRGMAADTGTCFELGFMCALGKPAFAYTNVRADQGERTRAHFKGEWYADAEGCPRGPDHLLIEDLGFIDNLMLHGGVVNRGGAVVVGDAPKGAELTDMTAFKEILKIAAGKLGGSE